MSKDRVEIADPAFLIARQAMLPLYTDLKQKMAELDEQTAARVQKLADDIQAAKLDEVSLSKHIMDLVADKIVVKTEHVENNIVAKVDMPPEISGIVVALATMVREAQKGKLRLEDFKAHDQYEPNDNIGYYGYLHPSGAWYIVRDEPGETEASQRYMFGTEGYAEAWENKLKNSKKFGLLSVVAGDAIQV